MDAHEPPEKMPKMENNDRNTGPNTSVADENNMKSNESKHDENVPTIQQSAEADIHSRCKFYIEKKKRCCKTQPPKGQQYCATHAQELGEETSRKRVICPYDSKHSCYEGQLQKHMKKCNSRPELLPPYYSKDINAGDEDGEDPNQYQVGLKDISDDELFKIIDKIRSCHKAKVGELRSDIQFHRVMQEEAEKPRNGLAAQKHIQQQASLIGHMERLQMLKSNTTFVEFGAGKGGLSHWLQLAVSDQTNTQFLLVDKGSVRYKMDNYHKGADQGPSFERIKLNIADLDLGKVKSLCEREVSVVGAGKHLCGGATDLMLRCLVETFLNSKHEKSSHLEGLVLALCCHHRCDWRTYVGKAFMREAGLSARDFHILTRLTSWAVCGTRPAKQEKGPKQKDSTEEDGSQEGIDKEDEENEEDEESDEDRQQPSDYNHPRYGRLSPEERAEIGYQSKQLIDAGRKHYLQTHKFDAQVVYYVDRDRTLENMALVATHDTH